MEKGTGKRIFAGIMAAAIIAPAGSIPNVRAQENGNNAAADQWEQIKTMLESFGGEWITPDYTGAVSDYIPQTALLGNGDVGVTSYGNATEKTYLISKGDFWNCGDMETNQLSGTNPNRISPLALGGITVRSARETVEEQPEAVVESCGYIDDVNPQWQYDPEGIIDGKMSADNELWACNQVHDVTGHHYFTIDLGQEKNLKSYMIYHQGAFSSASIDRNTRNYKVYISTDHENWTMVEEVKDNTESIRQFELPEEMWARYIKVDITDPATRNGDETARIAEMELFDSEGTNLITGEKTAAGEFLEKQNIVDGELTTEMSFENVPVIMNAWVSATENIMVTAITSQGESPVELEAEVWTKDDVAEFPAQSGMTDTTVWASRKTNNRAKENKKSWTSEAVIASKVIGISAEAKDSDRAEAALVFTLEPGQTVQIVTSIGGGGQTYDNTDKLTGTVPLEEAEIILGRYNTSEDISNLKEENDNWWKEYWMKSSINIGDSLLHKYYYGSLYYMGAASREDTLAPGIFGIWTTTDGAMWNGDYHMNYNYIAPFYGMYSSNRYEQAESMKDPLLDYMEEGGQRAKTDLAKIFPNYINGGAGTADSGVTFKGREDLKNGIEDAVLYPVSLGPWGSTPWQDANGGYLMQTYNAAFSSQALTAYYNYTYDGEYLQEIYPLLLASANFYEKWCEKEDLGGGEYRYNIWSGAHEDTFDLNAPTVTGAVKNILQCLLLGVENGHINPPEEKTAIWKDMEEHIADIPIENYQYGDFNKPVIPLSEKGVKLWPGSATVNLEFIHPGEQLGFDSEKELVEAAQNSIELKELVNSNIWNQINNTPKIYIQAVRCGYDPQYVIDKFKIHLNAMHKNFTIEDGVHGIEKAGAVEFINNMLLQSSNGIMKVFPNWTGTDASYTTLREKGAFLVSSELKEGTVQYVELISEKGTKARLVNPWGNVDVTLTDKNGDEVEYTKGCTENSGENTIEFKTEENQTYMITKSEGETEEVSKTTLEYFLNSAKEHVAAGDTEGLVESVRKLFDEAIAEGESVMADENATKDEVTNAAIKLMKAIQALDFKAGDKTDLEMALELAQAIDLTKYVEAGQAEYLAAKETAENVMADGDAMQDEVDAAWDALVDAMSCLRFKADKAALQELIYSLEGLNLSLYTEESVRIYSAAFARANMLLADAALSIDAQDEVDAAVKELTEAKELLVLKEENQSGSGDDQNPGTTETPGEDSQKMDDTAGVPDTDNSGSSGTGNGNAAQKAAKTGDTVNLVLWTAIMGAGAAIAGAASLKKKKYR